MKNPIMNIHASSTKLYQTLSCFYMRFLLKKNNISISCPNPHQRELLCRILCFASHGFLKASIQSSLGFASHDNSRIAMLCLEIYKEILAQNRVLNHKFSSFYT